MNVDVTFWRSLTDPSGTFASLTWDELAARLSRPAPKPDDPERPKLGGWSPATFAEARRAKERVQQVTALVLDVDAGDVPLERLVAAFAGKRRLIHSTRRATPSSPRWRVVVAVSRSMTAAEHERVWLAERDRLAGLGIVLDEQTKDPSRFWFLPCWPAEGLYVFDPREGQPLDVDTLIAYAPPLPERAAAYTAIEVEMQDGHVLRVQSEPDALARISPATRRKRAAAYLEHAEPAVSGEEGHKTAMRVVTAVVRGFALDEASALEVLAPWNARCSPPWSHAELVHKVREAERVGNVARGAKLLAAPEKAAEKKPEAKSDAAPTDLGAWNLLGTKRLAEPLPPIPWLCEPIRLAPGAVSLVAGYGYSRKTMALQSLALSVAAHRPLWGLYGVRKGRVVHLDYEQGQRLTKERYQRLGRGMGLELADLEDEALRVACMPRVYLETQDAIDSLLPVVDGAALVIVDSLRAAFPHADENSSDVRSYLDALNHLSERTGACIVVIHHARKPNAQNGGTATHAIRGSSALFDACQSVYVFEGEKDTPTTVHHQKDRVMGSTVEQFGLVSEDVGGADGARWGLRVRHLDAQQLDSRSVVDAAFEGKKKEIVRLIRSKREMKSATEIAVRLGGRKQAVLAALNELIQDGVIIRQGDDGPLRFAGSRAVPRTIESENLRNAGTEEN